jgi:arylsulfatase A-like enzyme
MIIKRISILCLSLLFVIQGNCQIPGKKPNIIFILTDDLGYGDIGALYQNFRQKNNNRSEPWLYTPNLDEMAKAGVLLTDHYCGAPVCAPSRASLLTGLSQGQANVRDNQFDKALADDYTLGNILQKAGYRTAVIGKWGLQGKGDGPDWPAHPLKRGFDYFFGYIQHRDGHEHYPKEAIYRNKATVWENYNDVTNPLDKCYTGDLWTAVAKKWIVEEQKSKQPFFLYLAYDLPHAALELPTMAYPAGKGLNGGVQWSGTSGTMINTARGAPDSWIDPLYSNATWDHDQSPVTEEQPWPETYKRYATVVSRLDLYVGDLLRLLKDLKIDTNTMVVFTSDNGPSNESYLPASQMPNNPNFFNSFGPFDGIKRDVWEGGVRVPALAIWPGTFKAGSKVAAPTAFYDWLPTLVNAAGLTAPAFSDGQTIFPLLMGQKKRQDRTVYIEYFGNGNTPGYKVFDSSHRKRVRNQMQMLRMNDTLAIRYNIQNASDDFEIYAINKDPKQKTNLALPAGKRQQDFLKNKVLQLRRADSSAKRPYDDALITAALNYGAIKDKMSWKFYKGKFLWIPELDELKPAAKGYTRKYTGIKFQKMGQGIVCYEGFFYAKNDGAHKLMLKTNVPLIMKMYDFNVFNQDFSFDRHTTYTATVNLKKGLHPIRIYTRVAKEDKQLFSISLQSPGEEMVLPFSIWDIENSQ